MGRFREMYNDPLLLASRSSRHCICHGLKLLLPFNFDTVFFSCKVPKKLNFNSAFFPFSKFKTGIKVHPFIGSGSYGY